MLYDPQGSAHQHRRPEGTTLAPPDGAPLGSGAYDADAPFTSIDYSRAPPTGDDKGVESFVERANTRGTIFMYQKKVAEQGVFYRGCRLECD